MRTGAAHVSHRSRPNAPAARSRRVVALARTCARARAASCRHAASLRSSAAATSLNEKSNTSCSRKAARSSGDSRSSVRSSAMDRILGQLRAAVGRERCRVNNRLRQPWTDVLLAPCARRGQHVETNPRRRGHEKRSRVRHVVAVGPMPAQVRLLHRVLGVGHRPKHSICEAEQAPTVRLEARGGIRHRVRGAHAVRAVIRRCGGSGPEPARRGPCRSAPPPWPRPLHLARCRCRDHRRQWPRPAHR